MNYSLRLAGIAGAIVLAGMASSSGVHQEAGYTDPGACTGCHREISAAYRRTGMGRSFYRPSPTTDVEDFTDANTFYHRASDSYFTMVRRGGKYYQRRFQLDPNRKEVNVMEKQIDFILGSGNHSRAYLNRTAQNKLIELPLAWYAEKGGYWAMNPGYDRPHHDGFRREIGYDCLFCHNAYPAIPAGNDQPFAEPVYAGSLPEGIDCQRCHGPGRKHADLAKTNGARREDIRNAIVNPSRLTADRQMEVCMQCHLETTSFPLPNSIQRYERGPFSYRPGEPLSAFILNFDHEAGKGRDDKYEIVNAAYRLRRSACFLKSKGALSCTTCHNPHSIPRGEEAALHYTAVCRQCHAAGFDRQVAAGNHPRSERCTECHMPKRRTEDVVHVVMTDHYIQRHKPVGDLLAEMAERHETEDNAYRGNVVPYYPKELPHMGTNDHYLGIAQVIQKSNLKDGIARFTAAIERNPPQRAEYYFELAEALRNDGQAEKAQALYREAIRRNPGFVIGLQKLAFSLRLSGQLTEAADFLKQAISAAPERASTWHDLGLTYQAQGKNSEAVAALEKAVKLDPDLSEAQNNLGAIRSTEGNPALAESAFREALRIQPDYADARYNLAVLLGQTRRYEDAQRELQAALRDDPELADAHMLLGDMLMAKGQNQEALPHYREAVRIQPRSGRAHLSLGSALIAVEDPVSALPHLQQAATDADASVSAEALRLLRRLR